jgi:hypothetical protein
MEAEAHAMETSVAASFMGDDRPMRSVMKSAERYEHTRGLHVLLKVEINLPGTEYRPVCHTYYM